MNTAKSTQVESPSKLVHETIRARNEDTKSFAQIQRLIADQADGMDDTMPVPQIGDRIESFRLIDQLGSGASCYVFRAMDERTQTPVALKILNWANTFDRVAAFRQLRTEAAALARVKHPKVLRFIDFGIDSRWPYVVTECIDGRPLGDLIREGGALPVDWAIYFTSQMIDALGAVWRAGMVHRDIKPDNVLIGPKGEAKLIDFGLAKAQVLQNMAGQQGPELAGTAAYLSPEQAKDASVVDLRADIYSLGVAFYEMLTGRLPFEGKNRIQMIYHHLNTVPTPPAAINPELSTLVSDMCMWMLVKNANERPQDYDELRQSFDTITNQ